VFFSMHPELIQRLKAEFIPVAFNVGAPSVLGRPESQTFAGAWFRKLWETTERAPVSVPTEDWSKTYQGWYIAAPDGRAMRLFGGNFSGSLGWHPANLQRSLDAAVAYCSQNPQPRVDVPSTDPDPRDGLFAAPTTSVVLVETRVPGFTARQDPDNSAISIGGPPSKLNTRVQRDVLWIYVDEVRAIVAATRSANEEVRLPGSLTGRLVRYCLTDLLAGRSTFFPGAEDVKLSAFSARLTGKTENRASYVFAGRFSCVRPPLSRLREAPEEVGRTGTVSGEFDIDTDAMRVVRFRAYSAGQAWGGRVEGHLPLIGPRFPLAFALTEANDPLMRAMHPAAYAMVAESYRKGAAEGASVGAPGLDGADHSWSQKEVGPEALRTIAGVTVRGLPWESPLVKVGATEAGRRWLGDELVAKWEAHPASIIQPPATKPSIELLQSANGPVLAGHRVGQGMLYRMSAALRQEDTRRMQQTVEKLAAGIVREASAMPARRRIVLLALRGGPVSVKLPGAYPLYAEEAWRPSLEAGAGAGLKVQVAESLPELTAALRDPATLAILNPYGELLPTPQGKWKETAALLHDYLAKGGAWIEVHGHPFWRTLEPHGGS